MKNLNLKPTHKAVKNYYEGLRKYESFKADYEMAIKEPFKDLLTHCAKQFNWTLIPEYKMYRGKKRNPISVDAALVDEFKLPRGYWEAKDKADDLEKEVKIKFESGYPRENMLFQQPGRAILYQNGELVLDEDITEPVRIVDVLKRFFEYQPPNLLDWESAVLEFQDRVPELGRGLLLLIREEKKINKPFIEAFTNFINLCRQSNTP